MKPLWSFCMLLSCLSSVAQTSNGVAVDSSDKTKPPKLEDFRIEVDREGRFSTPVGTMKQMSTLKVSDLPSSKDHPLGIETTVKCMMLESLVVENEKRDGALGRMVPKDVLTAVPAAASSCLVRNTMGLQENVQEFVIADAAAMVDTQAELDRREYNEVVDRYNALIEKHNALLAMTRSLASQLAAARSDIAAQQQRIKNALTIYEFMPKYTPPQTLNIQVIDCARLPALCVH